MKRVKYKHKGPYECTAVFVVLGSNFAELLFRLPIPGLEGDFALAGYSPTEGGRVEFDFGGDREGVEEDLV